MSKHQNETISSRESHVCHLTHQTARFWQFGRPVLGGNFWFPRWNSFILVFWHLYKAYLNVFTWICLLTFFYPMYPSNPQCIKYDCNCKYWMNPPILPIHLPSPYQCMGVSLIKVCSSNSNTPFLWPLSWSEIEVI